MDRFHSANQITRRADTEFAGVRMINSPSIAFAQRFNVPAFGTAITMEDGQKLRVHLWSVHEDLSAITEFEDSAATNISVLGSPSVSATMLGTGTQFVPRNLYTVVRDAANRLRVHLWTS